MTSNNSFKLITLWNCIFTASIRRILGKGGYPRDRACQPALGYCSNQYWGTSPQAWLTVCFCFCSKCCWESSRYNFFPSETFLGDKWICIKTFLGDKHFFSKNFLDGKLLSPRTYSITKFYHRVFSRCQGGDYCLWERSWCIVPCHRERSWCIVPCHQERSQGIVPCHQERSWWQGLFTLYLENTQW